MKYFHDRMTLKNVVLQLFLYFKCTVVLELCILCHQLVDEFVLGRGATQNSSRALTAVCKVLFSYRMGVNLAASRF